MRYVDKTDRWMRHVDRADRWMRYVDRADRYVQVRQMDGQSKTDQAGRDKTIQTKR